MAVSSDARHFDRRLAVAVVLAVVKRGSVLAAASPPHVQVDIGLARPGIVVRRDLSLKRYICQHSLLRIGCRRVCSSSSTVRLNQRLAFDIQ